MMFIADKIIYRDNDKFIKLYIGDDLVWKKTNVEDNKYVTFTAEENLSSIGLARLSSNQVLEYSIDTINWLPMNTDLTICLPNVGDEVYIRGILNADIVSDDYTKFKMSGKIAASGNCNALWNYEDVEAPLKKCCGQSLFHSCASLTKAPELPATTLSPYCYSSMFTYCTSLTQAPILPATTLADYCYHQMFYNCKLLTQAPELPATTLAQSCYGGMFIYCTSLKQAPEILPATTLADYCYNQMFAYCHALTKAPKLPATTLVFRCYLEMFDNCSSLKEITCLATDNISERDWIYGWVTNVPKSGTFYRAPGIEWPKGSSGIPSDWTVVDYEDT